MNFINPPEKSARNVFHKTFYSQVLKHDVGYNIYLPPDYKDSGEKYPVVHYIHGWKGNESSDIWSLEKVYKNRRAITVFINAISTEEDYFDALLQIESIIIGELIPHIDSQYRTNAGPEGRMLSGFSMGGNMAFYYAVKNLDLFGTVTAIQEPNNNFITKNNRILGLAPEKAKGV